MNRSQAVASVVVASSMLLSGCAFAATDAPAPSAAIATYEFAPGDSGLAANVTGVLDFDSGCVRFQDGRVPVFAGPAVAWDGPSLLVEGRQYRDGEYFVSAGGEDSVASSENSGIPAACEGGPRVAISPSRIFMRALIDAAVEPCHGEFVADVDTGVAGASSPEEAAREWVGHGVAPSGAPVDGWTSNGPDSAFAHGWSVGSTRTLAGGWVVSGLTCLEAVGETD